MGQDERECVRPTYRLPQEQMCEHVVDAVQSGTLYFNVMTPTVRVQSQIPVTRGSLSFFPSLIHSFSATILFVFFPNDITYI